MKDKPMTMTHLTRSFESRRALYRRSRRVLVGLLAGRWPGHGRRRALERAARTFLRDRTPGYLARVVGDRGFALTAAAAIMSCMVTPRATALPPVELSDVAAGTGGFVMNGIDDRDNSGRNVSGAGDVNGDGLADLIVGAFYADPGGRDSAGESYVVFGKADTTPVNLSDVAAGTGGFVMNGIDAYDHSGFRACGAGDVNGDGLADLIVGAALADPGGRSSAGESYVVFGKADTAPVNLSDVAAGTGGFVMNGIDAGDGSGGSVSGAGDVNGDGMADLIVGAGGGDPGGRDRAGESYVVFGKADTAPVNLSDVAAGTGGFVMNGIDAGDGSGGSVSGAGDVNGDGMVDLIVGARRADPGGRDYAGESYVVFGKADTAPVNLSDVAAGTGGFVMIGIDVDDLSCYSVSGAGDVNGDGLADLIVGARGGDPGGRESAGESYVVFGKADTAPVNLSDVAAGTGGFVMNGIDVDDYSGNSVSGAGDVNGDGRADLIVGALFADPGGRDRAGESYVVFGKADTAPVNLSDVAAGTGGFVMNGSDEHDRSGFSVSGAGDVNGDGLADLIVGAPAAAPPSKGESYVVFATAPGCFPADLDESGAVDFGDILAVLSAWGCTDCPEDLDESGVVDFEDLLLVLSSWGPCAPPRPVDDCVDAHTAGDGAYEFSTVNATTDGESLPAECDEGNGRTFRRDVWLRYRAWCTGTATASVCSSDFNTRLAVYATDCAGDIVACSDDACGEGGTRSEVTFAVVGGDEYLVRVGGRTSVGTGTLVLSCQP